MWIVMTWMVGCGEPSTCRPETVLQIGEPNEDFEGNGIRSCMLTLDLCDDGSFHSVDCTNDTFDGTYECACLGALLGGSSTFESDGICEMPDEQITDAAIAGCKWDVIIES